MASAQLALQIGEVAVEVDLHGVAPRGDEALANVLAFTGGPTAHFGGLRQFVLAGQVPREQSPLSLDERHDGAERLRQTGEHQPAVLEVKTTQEERQLVVRRGHEARLEERKCDALARAEQHRVGEGVTAVRKAHACAVPTRDGGTGRDAPFGEQRQQVVRKRGVRVAEVVVRRRQAVRAGSADE